MKRTGFSSKCIEFLSHPRHWCNYRLTPYYLVVPIESSSDEFWTRWLADYIPVRFIQLSLLWLTDICWKHVNVFSDWGLDESYYDCQEWGRWRENQVCYSSCNLLSMSFCSSWSLFPSITDASPRLASSIESSHGMMILTAGSV